VGGVSRIARVPIVRLRIAGISVGWVAIIGARWRWRCTRNSPKYPGCPSDRCSKGGSRPATRCCSNGSTRSRSQYSPTEAALNRIIRVSAGREAQRRHGDHTGRNSGHYRSPIGRRPGRTDNDNGYNDPFLSTNLAARVQNPCTWRSPDTKMAPYASSVSPLWDLFRAF